MTSLYSLRYSALDTVSLNDVKNWTSSRGFFDISSCLIDRSGILKTPIRTQIHPSCHLPDHVPGFSKDFTQICHERVKEIIRHQDKFKKKIGLFYSGGIDSTATLCAFLKELNLSEFNQRIIVYLNQSSINENPVFYEKYIRRDLKFESSEKFSHLIFSEVIVLNSLLCGWLFGPTKYIKLATEIYGFEILEKNMTIEIFSKILSKEGHSAKVCFYWYELLKKQISEHRDHDITNVFDFLWWFVFIFGWQSDYLKMILRTNFAFNRPSGGEIFETHYLDFYNSHDFQRWSMANKQRKIERSWESFKSPVKDFIFAFNKDSEYRNKKVKVPSLSKLFHNNLVPEGLTENYEFLDKVDWQKFYDPRNSFS